MLKISKAIRFAAILISIVTMCMSIVTTSFAANNIGNEVKYLPNEVVSVVENASKGIYANSAAQVTDNSSQILNDAAA